MAANLTIFTHKIAIQLHLLAEICTICCSSSKRPVRKPLDTHSYTIHFWLAALTTFGRYVNRMSDELLAILTQIFRGLFHSLQPNNHKHITNSSIQFIICLRLMMTFLHYLTPFITFCPHYLRYELPFCVTSSPKCILCFIFLNGEKRFGLSHSKPFAPDTTL
jgi:hypothetical protein